MKTYLGIPLIVFISSTLSFAQGLYLSGTTGIGSYRMGMMKTFQKDILSNSTVPLQVTNSFAPNFYYGASIGYDFGNHELGFIFNQHSSSGRMIHSENNLFINFDQVFSARDYGLSLTEKFLFTEAGYFYGSIAGMVNISSGSIISDVRLNKYREVIRHDLTSLGFSGGVFGGFAFVKNKLALKPEVGYLLNFFNNGLVMSESPHYRIMYKNEDLKVNWSGFRFNLTLSYHFKGHKAFEKEELKPTDWSF